MLVSDVGTGLESPRGLPDETIVRAIRVIDRTTTVSLALLGLLILVRIVAGPAGLVDWLTALAVLVVGAGLLVQRRGGGRPRAPPPRPPPSRPPPPPPPAPAAAPPLLPGSLTVPPSRTTLPADLLVPDPGHADAADSSEARREGEERLGGRPRGAPRA